MGLATQCPGCGTVFRISTSQAAAKGGSVRCGQCRNVFNSLDALVRVEDLDPAAVRVEAAMSSFDEAALTRDYDSRTGVAVEPSSEEVEPAESPVVVEAPDASPVDPAKGAVFKEWWVPLDDAPATSVPSGALASDRNTGQHGPPSDRKPATDWPRGASILESDLLRAEEPPPARSRSERVVLAVLSTLAIVGLVAQAGYVWRNELAARWPAAKPALVAACASLRCVVDYPVHPDAITIESTALQSSAPNASLFTLTTLLRNRDALELRYPHLELTLTDTQDRVVLRRVLRPADYLPPSALRAGFAAESELPVRVLFELDDLRFAGYRLEKFYP